MESFGGGFQAMTTEEEEELRAETITGRPEGTEIERGKRNIRHKANTGRNTRKEEIQILKNLLDCLPNLWKVLHTGPFISKKNPTC